MRREVLENMDDHELDAYGNALGIKFDKNADSEAKVERILEAKQRTVDITIFGETFVVPLRRARDKRVADLLEKGSKLTNADGVEIAKLILGEEQAQKLFDLCIDDDGVNDSEALGIAIALLISNDDLKKY
ncbi:MAG: hypothetical protein LUC17_02660 [Oscillospiraceae bacterium]|nr:hypothetical protein [Oscillospiraceae bacterium]